MSQMLQTILTMCHVSTFAASHSESKIATMSTVMRLYKREAITTVFIYESAPNTVVGD